MTGKWKTVESKVNKKPKESKQKKRQDDELDEGEAWLAAHAIAPTSYNFDTSENSAFAGLQQARQQREKNREERKEQSAAAREANAKKRAAEREAVARRRAAQERARKARDPTAWPMLGDALLANKDALVAELQTITRDDPLMATPALRLQYAMGTVEKHAERCVAWPVNEEAYDAPLDLPVGPALDDSDSAELLHKVNQRLGGSDIDAHAIASVLMTYFGPKGMKEDQPGKGVGARAVLQLIIRRHAAVALAGFQVIANIFVDPATGSFNSKSSFLNCVWVVSQMLLASEGIAFLEPVEAEIAAGAAVALLNCAAGTTNAYNTTLINDFCMRALELGVEGTESSVTLSPAAAVAAVRRAGENVAERNALLEVGIPSNPGEALPALVRAAEAESKVFLDDQSPVAELFLAAATRCLEENPEVAYKKWAQRVEDCTVATAALLANVVGEQIAVDDAFVSKAAPLLQQIRERKRSSPQQKQAAAAAVTMLKDAVVVDIRDTAFQANTSAASTNGSAKGSIPASGKKRGGASPVSLRQQGQSRAAESDDNAGFLAYEPPFILRALVLGAGMALLTML